MNTPATTHWFDTPPLSDGASERQFLLRCLRDDADSPVQPETLAALLALCTTDEPAETGPAELALWIDLLTATLKDPATVVGVSTAADVSPVLDRLMRRRRAGVRARRAQLSTARANAAAESEIIGRRMRAVEDHLSELRELQAVAVLAAIDAGVTPDYLDLSAAEVRDLLDHGRQIDPERRRWLLSQWRDWAEWPQDRIRDLVDQRMRSL